VGLGRLELPTSPLSGVRSSHLSYRPNLLAGNILRDLAHSSNNGAISIARRTETIRPEYADEIWAPSVTRSGYDDGLSGTGAVARKSSRKRKE
jgi:hypothetical protein